LQDDTWCGSQLEDGRDRKSKPDIQQNIENEIITSRKTRHDNAGSQALDISKKNSRIK